MTTARPRRATSVWALPVHSGGCGACVQQMAALLGPRYADELRARGIALALSPRHADVVLIAGPLSRAAHESVARLLESVPQPRALVAVGDCAINGCVFHGSALVAESAAEALDMNVEIAGCPPAPTAILDAIVEASQILAADASSPSGEIGEDDADEADEDDEEDTLVEVADEVPAAGELNSADESDGEDA